MKTRIFMLTLIAVPMLVGSALSQEAGSGNTMTCTTEDGIITIQGNSVQMRDYNMTIESVEREGVIRLVDAKNNTTAILDSRDPDGLYIAITENGTQMQVVAPRPGMVFSGTMETENNAAAPANPEMDIVRELSQSYRTAAYTAAVR